MQVALILYVDHVGTVFTNTSSIELRLWELWNSWGWWSISFQLKDERQDDFYSISRQEQEWTINGPTYFTLAPGEKREIAVDLKDGTWEGVPALSHLKDKKLSIRISYNVGFRPEADEYSVFVGSALSDWVTSKPPHRWLFAGI